MVLMLVPMAKSLTSRLINNISTGILIKTRATISSVSYKNYFNYNTTTDGLNINKNKLKDIHIKVDHTHLKRKKKFEKEGVYDEIVYKIKNKQNVVINENNINLLNTCKNAYELVNVLNRVGSMTKVELEIIGKKILELVSEDMKQNSILLLTLNEFGLDTTSFLDKLKSYEFRNNEHIILRSISESKISKIDDEMLDRINDLYDKYFNNFNVVNVTSDVNNEHDGTDVTKKLNNTHSDGNDSDKEKYMELYNYICSYCKFVFKNIIKDYKHMNKIESYIKGYQVDNINNINMDDYSHVYSERVDGPLDNLKNFTITQLVDLCYNLACVNSECCKLVLNRLDEMDFYKKIHYSELIHMFTKVASYDGCNSYDMIEKELLNLYKKDEFKLELEECVNLIVSIGRSRRFGVMLIDKVVEDIKKYMNELELEQISKILINLSKVNYNNRGFIRNLSNLILKYVDEDSILEPYIISNIIKSLGRFQHYNDKLISILLTVMAKEEVIVEFQVHDLITIFKSLTRIFVSNKINSAKAIKLSKYMGILAREIGKGDINTDMAIDLINASGKILYNNEKYLNTLIESINLKEVDDLSKLYKLKVNADKLSLYYPELTQRIEMLESKLRPRSDEADEKGEDSERNRDEGNSSPRFERTVYVRNYNLYKNLRLPSVRRRKWTY